MIESVQAESYIFLIRKSRCPLDYVTQKNEGNGYIFLILRSQKGKRGSGQRRDNHLPVIGMPQNPNRAFVSKTSSTLCVGEKTIGSVMKPFS